VSPGFVYGFTGATGGTPSAGYFEFNNGTVTSVTQIYVSNTDWAGVQTNNTIPAGVTVLLVDQNSGAQAAFNVLTSTLSVIGPNGYCTLGVSILDTTGTFTPGDLVAFSYAQNGSTGPTGPTGPPVSGTPTLLLNFTGTVNLTQNSRIVLTPSVVTNDSLRAYASGSGKYTPTVSGWYQVIVAIYVLGTPVSGYPVIAYIYKNGTAWATALPIDATASANSGGDAQALLSAIVYLNGSTDYIQFEAFTSWSGTTVGTSIANSWISAFKIPGTS
jgi:hypothetical protein